MPIQPVTASAYHVPVLLSESVDGLNVRPGGVYVDVTFGGGGHSREILSRLGEKEGGRLFGFDQDLDAAANVPQDDRFTFVWSNFRWLKNWMRYYGVEKLDGIIADLGVSAHHFDEASRGFSLRFEDSPLDMRMNARAPRTAADVLATESQERLSEIFRIYGNLRRPGALAGAVVRARESAPILTAGDLTALVQPFFAHARRKKDTAKLFQALRMEVNHEPEALRSMLSQAVGLLRPGGRLVVITYQSVEDRIVKNAMRSGDVEENTAETVTRGRPPRRMTAVNKVTVPSEEEVEANPRSRSAKLRVGEKT